MRTALITGANRGIGFEIARQLGLQQFHIILSARNEEKLQQAASTLSQQGISVTPLVMDVSNVQSIQSAARTIQQPIDVLINNAAILPAEDKSIIEFPAQEVIDAFHTNALAALFVTQAFQHLLPKGARVVNISSGAGEISDGESGWAPLYSATKTALNAITIHLAAALRHQQVAVNAVCPGWVRTDMGGRNASRPVEKGAETPVWLATEAPQRITGKFLRDKKEIAW
jgi:NAD(P)-dependent dehydrogenase (short-subunit alcohol dehydrogenase family)